MAAAAGQHPIQGCAGAVDDALDVDVEDPVGQRLRYLVDTGDRHDPGVVHQNIDRADLGLDAVAEGVKRRPVGDVEGQCQERV